MRELFELDPSLIYLNSGTHSICPREVSQAVTTHQREYERNPTMALVEVWSRLWAVQKELADFFNARPEDLFLCHNVTEALNNFILEVPLKPAGEILLTDLEYGAVENLCRYRAERSGLALRACKPDEVVQNLRHETRLVVISHVCTGTGQVMDLKTIAAATRARGILLAIDGAHAPGALALDFSELGDLDFYGGNLHKWMLGPKGTGFGWVHRRLHASLAPHAAGWPTFEEPDYLSVFGAGNRFTQRLTLMGCRDFAPFLAIGELLVFWRRVGPHAIRARITELQSATEAAMLAKGWRTISPPRGNERGPLLSFDLRDEWQPAGGGLLLEIFKKHRLQVQVMKMRGRWTLRLSPHIYNTEDEIERAAKILAFYL